MMSLSVVSIDKHIGLHILEELAAYVWFLLENI